MDLGESNMILKMQGLPWSGGLWSLLASAGSSALVQNLSPEIETKLKQRVCLAFQIRVCNSPTREGFPPSSTDRLGGGGRSV
jgi:hypothetical protein